jgi:LysM repeat protein
VKSIFSSRRSFIVLFLLAAFLLAACERQIQEDDGASGTPTLPVLTPPAQPTIDPALVPTTDPALIPTTDPALIPTTDPALVPTPVPGGSVQVTPPATGQSTYTVVAGDTLFNIARTYGLTIEELAAANGIDPNGLLTPGQTLVIPTAGGTAAPTVVAQPTTAAGEQVHVVAAGENLFRIGLRYGFTVAELAAYNGIANPHYIYVGQTILIPPGGNPQ